MQSCCGNAKGQRDRLPAGTKAATCCSGQQGIRLQSRVGRERTERERKQAKSGEQVAGRKKDLLKKQSKCTGRDRSAYVYVLLCFFGCVSFCEGLMGGGLSLQESSKQLHCPIYRDELEVLYNCVCVCVFIVGTLQSRPGDQA